jgi:hypothetical protein
MSNHSRILGWVVTDVDIIAEIGSYADDAIFSERLRALGFQEDTREGAPVCRWTCDR